MGNEERSPGGGASDLASFSSVPEYVKALGGTHPIRRVLIANNGIAAVKCIRSVRRFAYETFGNERAIHFTVMTTAEDIKANAEYIRMADEFVEVPGGANNNNYANVQRIVETAEAVQADAVWAGWGHASENPLLPETLSKTGKIVFIGPDGRAMRALGDKIGSTLIAQSAGVPTISWNAENVNVNYKQDGLSQDVLDNASVKSVEEAMEVSEKIGYPLMIKASEGGGGKGIRKVTSAEQVKDAFRQVQAELPGSPVFIMRLVHNARHLEVQLLADKYGEAIPLSGRDCSVQRRHQKIIEEGPVQAASQDVIHQMEAAAVSLAKEVDYCNAGTVEYLFQPKDDSFAFLELNPRLQVEHPVTEMISGVNLPAAQFQVAMGIPLSRIPDVRRLYGHSAFGTSKIDFSKEKQQLPGGHVIASRITAENPDSGFQPTSGAVTEVNFRSTPDVWGYFSVDSSGRVHEYADSQIGHLFSWGNNREIARRNMCLALKELSIRGDIRTTTEYLIGMMESEDFRQNNISTEWLDSRISKNIQTEKPEPLLVAVIGAVVRGYRTIQKQVSEYVDCLERGQTPSSDLLSMGTNVELIYDNVKYEMTTTLSGPNTITVAINGSYIQIDLRVLSDGGMLILLDGKSHLTYATEEATGLRLLLNGATCMFSKEYDPTQLRVSMSGKLSRYLVDDQQHIEANQAYAEIEVMKMYMQLVAPESGNISLIKPEGSVLEPGELVASVELDDPGKVRRSELYSGQLPAHWDAKAGNGDFGSGTSLSGSNGVTGYRKANTVARNAINILESALDGYKVPHARIRDALMERDLAFCNPHLPLLEFEELLFVLSSRLPTNLSRGLSKLVANHKKSLQDGTLQQSHKKAFPRHPTELDLTPVKQMLYETAQSMGQKEREVFYAVVQPLHDLIDKYSSGVAGANRKCLVDLVRRFLNVEMLWGGAEKDRENYDDAPLLSGRASPSDREGKQDEDVVAYLRTLYSGRGNDDDSSDARGFFGDERDDTSLRRIYSLCRAHHQLPQRSQVVIEILDRIFHEIDAVKACKLHENSVRKRGDSYFTENKFETDFFDRQEAEQPHTGYEEEEKVLHQLAELRGVQYAEVTLEARQILIHTQQPSTTERMVSVEKVLRQTNLSRESNNETDGGNSSPELERTSKADPLISLLNYEQPMIDILFAYFAHQEAALRKCALEVYVRRLYRAYQIQKLQVEDRKRNAQSNEPALLARWLFSSNTAEEVSESQRDTGRLERTRNFGSNFAGITPADSFDDLASVSSSRSRRSAGDSLARKSAAGPHVSGVSPRDQRVGVIAVLEDIECLGKSLASTLAAFDSAKTHSSTSSEPKHVLHFALLCRPSAPNDNEDVPGFDSDESISNELEKYVTPYKAQLQDAGVRRITFLIPNIGQGVKQHSHDISADTGGRLVNLFDESNWEVLPPLDKVKGRYEQGLKLSAIASAFYSCSQALGQNVDLYSVGAADAEGSSVPWQLVGFPRIYTLRAAEEFCEDSTVRHIEPPMSGYLELRRLRNFKVKLVPTPNRSIHVYEAVPKPDRCGGELVRGVPRKRYFVRAIVRNTARLSTVSTVEEQFPGPERMFVDALDALDIAMGDSLQNTRTPVGGNHIFLNVLPTAQVHPEYIESVIRRLAKRYSERLRRSRVSQVEFKVNAQFKVGGPIVPVRLVSSNPTGYVLRVDTYVETQPNSHSHSTPIFTAVPSTKMFLEESGSESGTAMEGPYGQSHLPPLPGTKESMLGSILRHGQMPKQSGTWKHSQSTEHDRSHIASEQKGELDGKPISTPYPVATAFEAKRALAAAISDTLWCYDFIELFERALEQKWYRYEKQRRSEESEVSRSVRRPKQVLKATELVLRPREQRFFDQGLKQTESSSSAGNAGMRRNYSDIFANEMGAPPTTTGRRTNLPNQGKGAIAEVDESEESGSPKASPKATSRPSASSNNEDMDHMDYELVPEERPPGQNSIGMVAWHVKMFTPTHPEESGGRDLVIIANDITHRAGSFGTMEDRLFLLATEYARKLKIPRIYLAANSGARIGLAEEVKSCFRVQWIDENDPCKGYKYLYVTEEDYERLSTHNSINAEKYVTPNGEVQYVIQDIIGKDPDLGVENLRGSGTIAGETSKAYQNIFTLTYVTGRSVGIGAYLVRLGQRVIQKSGSAPIILTGYQALNKLIGNQVYKSNLQLGGPKVMYANGVSHEVVNDDLDGVISVLNWLSYIPRTSDSSLPIADMPPGESIERPVEVFPPKDSAMDPRYLLAGKKETVHEENSVATFRRGFFDKNSFTESLSGWARTVIVGRARLGGIPMGVVIPETRAVSSTLPADPAMPSSHETVNTQAGQVWYPDSAYKTSQAIQDFNHEGLPLMIFANWRGFSGGQRDMFEQVLKFGSYIVDALVDYKHPVFVYVPPLGELRGGAWVVVDPTINQSVMEMYSDPTGRGGVLEPSGAASIKFRDNDIKSAAHRLDSRLQELDSKLAVAKQDNNKNEISNLQHEIFQREQLLQSTYLQISHSFADLHDTPGRMYAKGVIRDIVPWEKARSFFYWRLRRRMAEFALNDRLLRAAPQLKRDQANDLIRMWFSQHVTSGGGNAAALWENDMSVLRWLANSRDVLETRARELQRESVSEQVLELGTQDPYAVVSGILAMLQHLPSDKKEATLGALRRAVLFDDSGSGIYGPQQALPRPEQTVMSQQRNTYPEGGFGSNYYSRPPAPPGDSHDLRDNLYLGFGVNGNVEASSRSVESRDSSDKIVF